MAVGVQRGSIPSAMWWGVSTLTTVGYGDVYPITPLGKIIGACMAVLGTGLFAMPAAIWGAAFVERMVRKQNAPVICPHCGKAIEQGAEPLELCHTVSEGDESSAGR